MIYAIVAVFVAFLADVHGAPSFKHDVTIQNHGDVCQGASDLNTHWSGVQKNSKGRVTSTAFIEYFSSTPFGKSVSDKAAYKAYLTGIFADGWAMMPHKSIDETPTLGGHCFKSVATVPFEYYKDGSNGGYCELFNGGSASTEMRVTKQSGDVCSGMSDLDKHWDGVEKNNAGRVTVEAFISYFSSTPFGKSVSDKAAYNTYLSGIFASGWDMMPHKSDDETPTLGGHCFRSVAHIPFEFYKDGSNGGYCELFNN